ncbi:hypothetical protein EMIHUDRAFT_220774 [Emiliania huxleyi CCMP1516]|uniref:Uncharacterized protein n=2 Tax=Emiliania huxleyi TaxID=2903 RepID=A0A0D3I092_EMIH1|nr:hypothetical protein EMIHUDRAFT_220774 [Emiliania huxleyi CCMP1516]EOD04677.1 hypothetical protein EMIHUDRAFT_220774 [Emiliania huxleyi CCMP1516]|eukprot:XP_005757106.1 hypothetical protein EMIHUDRAFT_220774 [Emiliania huxleyi CCMP1516]
MCTRCAVRRCEFAGCAAHASPPVQCLRGHPASLGGEELALPLPNPPFTPKAALGCSAGAAAESADATGAAGQVYCRFLYRLLEVPLPKHGEVSLPKGGCVYDFVCAPAALLDTLAHEPLLVELWHTDKHTDKYAADSLLGIATVDLAELIGEWEAKEAERERASARQRRGLAAAEAELRGKVAELEREQRRMRGVEAALTAKVAAAEQKAAHEAALRQATHQGELAAAQAALGQASGKVAMLEERLAAAEAREVTLHEARAKLDGAVSAAEQRKQQALAAHRDLQRLEAEVRESESK